MSETLPPPDADRIRRCVPRRNERRIIPAGSPAVRVHPLGGTHPVAWNQLRWYGPTNSRFDHHAEPAHLDANLGVAYIAVNHGRPNALTTAIGEVAQRAGTVVPIQINQPDNLYVTVFETAADLNLLDLTTGWITRAGGNNAISSGPRAMSRRWARLIHEHHSSIHGLFYESSIYPPGRCVALWERGAHCLPATPLTSRSLVDIAPQIDKATKRLGTFTV